MLFAPQLLSGWGARAIEGWIGSQIGGTVEVTGVELSWTGEQRAKSVTITSPGPNPRQVIQATVLFPSLVQLLGDATQESELRLHVRQMRSRVESDGTSDLGRALGIDESSGITVADRISDLALLLLEKTTTADPNGDVASVRLHITVDDASIDDRASGRGIVEIEDLDLVATANRLGTRIDLRKCVLSGTHLQGVAEARADAQFRFDGDGVARLARAELDVDPLPRVVLQSLGIVGRVRSERDVDPWEPKRRRDIYDIVAPGLRGLFAAFIESGAALSFRLGRRPDEAGGAPDEVPVTLSVDSPGVGALTLAGELRNDTLIPRLTEEGQSAIELTLEHPESGLESLFRTVLPERVVIEDGARGATWRLTSNNFRLPINPEWARLSRPELVEDETRRERIAAWLRSIDVTAALRTTGTQRAQVTFHGGAEGGYDGPYHRLDWTHELTELRFGGELGGSLTSNWRPQRGQAARGKLARIDIGLPGRGLGLGDDPVGELSLDIPGMTEALLYCCVDIPAELLDLLPSRFHKVALTGVSLNRFFPGARAGNRAGAAGQRAMTMGIDVWTDPSTRFLGQLEGGTFRMPRGEVSIELESVVCDQVLVRLMPWLAEVEPAQPGTALRIEMKDLEFEFTSGDFREGGEVVLRPAPLRVKLLPTLMEQFAIDEDEEGWIEWTPEPIRLSLETNVIRYRKVELPLGDTAFGMDGRLDRKDQQIMLVGPVDRGRLAKLAGDPAGGALPVQVTIGGPVSRPSVLVDPDFLQSALKELMSQGIDGDDR